MRDLPKLDKVGLVISKSFLAKQIASISFLRQIQIPGTYLSNQLSMGLPNPPVAIEFGRRTDEDHLID
jgi:hypothetical protein